MTDVHRAFLHTIIVISAPLTAQHSFIESKTSPLWIFLLSSTNRSILRNDGLCLQEADPYTLVKQMQFSAGLHHHENCYCNFVLLSGERLRCLPFLRIFICRGQIAVRLNAYYGEFK